MIGCWCEQALVEKIDRARGSRTRSQFCREAVAEKLRTMGFEVPERQIASPDRAGKGGPKRVFYPIPRHHAQLNESRADTRASAKRPARKRTASTAKPDV